MCHFTVTYHNVCKHYSRRRFEYCLTAELDPVVYSRGCHNTTDMGVRSSFTECVTCQRVKARKIFFRTGSEPELQDISYGIIASRGPKTPSVVVTSSVETCYDIHSSPCSSRRSSVASGTSSASSTSSPSSGGGSYGGWAFKEGKFRNIHWRMYQPETQQAQQWASPSMYAVAPRQLYKKSGGDLLKSCREHDL
ncbi:hypothetical protein CERZMDRAFT_81886 [Cercospora zeae-maydis SCOH1-5]|uniref:Uncharacterized protein n=1 Tax=Cercospora zeae-maydis SCOH1-5 TaxID=717836 RepID=A0A6A6FQN4_9PEZI|nr:hypothetical protein CERZMDRAFT_81886 [Cercospora zeae-maydis SCOH1-5]